jgi:hypothetical protein
MLILIAISIVTSKGLATAQAVTARPVASSGTASDITTTALTAVSSMKAAVEPRSPWPLAASAGTKGAQGASPVRISPSAEGASSGIACATPWPSPDTSRKAQKQPQRHEAQVAQPAQRVGQFEPLPDVQQGGHRMLPAGARAAAGRG